jgi:hypothetical protein
MFREASMRNFAFHGWVLVEIFRDAGLVGRGNASLSPLVTKACIDAYLRPLLRSSSRRSSSSRHGGGGASAALPR